LGFDSEVPVLRFVVLLLVLLLLTRTSRQVHVGASRVALVACLCLLRVLLCWLWVSVARLLGCVLCGLLLCAWLGYRSRHHVGGGRAANQVDVLRQVVLILLISSLYVRMVVCSCPEPDCLACSSPTLLHAPLPRKAVSPPRRSPHRGFLPHLPPHRHFVLPIPSAPSLVGFLVWV
jgi:hypothetical protein